jgi:ANTAR domain/GAF domain
MTKCVHHEHLGAEPSLSKAERIVPPVEAIAGGLSVCSNGIVQDSDGLIDLESNFSQVAVALFAAGTVNGTLQRIVDLAVIVIDGCEAAGILIVDEDTVTTAAASSALVFLVDQLQIDAGEGPCLDASTQGSACYAEDLIDDNRWQVFAPSAVAASIRTVLACPLSAERPGALNLYATLPAAFGATDRAKGQLFATLAGLALNSAEERASDERRSANLVEALRTRELIGQAQGILMERERISGEQAFDVLRRASQHMNIKLREVAETLVETGESPETETPSLNERPGRIE